VSLQVGSGGLAVAPDLPSWTIPAGADVLVAIGVANRDLVL
jgi:hypothetical protein